MFGQESKLKIKEIFVYTAEQELSAEKLRQVLCSMREFEPYAAFRRIDRSNTGLIDRKSLCQF
jgi:Ca2+-binding EF-hand superfamily protein